MVCLKNVSVDTLHKRDTEDDDDDDDDDNNNNNNNNNYLSIYPPRPKPCSLHILYSGRLAL
jgi:hypothetical protein